MKFNVTTSVPLSIFRAYDIRGVVGQALTADIVYTIGLAIGSEAQDGGEQTIIVARDGRLSGPVLMEALTQGLLASGCDVIDVGLAPTPVLYFATYSLAARSGVMLTGSHNPPDYNGLKMMLGGITLAEERIQALYQRIQQQNFRRGAGQLYTQTILENYVARITSDVKLQRPLKVVIDCGNGVAGCVAPALFKALGCEVVELFCTVDGAFPNHHPDPSVAANLQDLIAAVRQHGADIGLAFDGDGDRLGVVTDQGEIIWPDRQLMLFAIDVLKRNPGATIIYDVKCTSYLENIVKQHNGKPLMWKTGHSLVKAKLCETAALLAGEMSGHIFFKERWYGFDDGLYAAARLLEIVSKTQESVSQLFRALPDSVNTPELKLPMAEEEKFTFMERLKTQLTITEGKKTTIDGLRIDFADGWGLVRPSNTTPCLVLRFEAENLAGLKRVQELFRQELLAIDTSLDLPF